jgi:hypothetical protein
MKKFEPNVSTESTFGLLRNSFMRISVVAIIGLLFIGCESSRQSALLTPEQAKTVARQLANEKAGALYHCQPFQEGQPASFAQGHWIWRDTRSYGRGDIEATVELAVDGSTNNVELQLLDSQLPRAF